MNDHNLFIPIERAKAVIASLIESRENLTDSEIEANLFAIQSFLCNVSKGTKKPLIENVRPDVQDDIFDAIIEVRKMRETAFLFLESCFTNEDSDKRECILTSALASYAVGISEILDRAESKFR